MSAIPSGTYTILNFYTRTILQPMDDTSGAYVSGAAQGHTQNQQWYVIYAPWQGGYMLQNVASGPYASSTQISNPFNGYGVLQLNSKPDYFDFELGTENGTYFISPKKIAPKLLDLFEYEPNGPVILNAKDPVSPEGAPPLKGSGN